MTLIKHPCEGAFRFSNLLTVIHLELLSIF